MNRFFTSWSGGKDSCFALMKAMEQGNAPVVLLNMMNENGMVSRSHAIPKAILERQAQMINLPIVTKPARWEEYEKIFIETLHELKTAYNITTGVFGDIDLQAHRDWEEKVCSVVGIEAILPLWKQNRKTLVHQMTNCGIETYIVSCNEVMGEKFLGRRITPELILELEEIGVDACGENGEYHTLVVDAPIFQKRIAISFGRKLQHNNFWFIEMELNDDTEQKEESNTNNPLREGEDYYIENGLFVFTAKYLLKRGYCCGSGCKHCPYGFHDSEK